MMHYWFRLPPIFRSGDHNAAMIVDLSARPPSSGTPRADKRLPLTPSLLAVTVRRVRDDLGSGDAQRTNSASPIEQFSDKYHNP
jgi:hypothetical protein